MELLLFSQVDRSVSGLVAQQQCVGPLHTPLANVAVVALSHFDKVCVHFDLQQSRQDVKCSPSTVMFGYYKYELL